MRSLLTIVSIPGSRMLFESDESELETDILSSLSSCSLVVWSSDIGGSLIDKCIYYPKTGGWGADSISL